MGAPDLLWPRGCESVEDTPSELVMAVDHANRICDWHENLPHDEVPPSWMWPFDDEIRAWFDEVEEKRNEKRGSGGGGPNGPSSVPMMENEMAEGRGG